MLNKRGVTVKVEDRNGAAKSVAKAELKRADVSYTELAHRSTKMGL